MRDREVKQWRHLATLSITRPPTGSAVAAINPKAAAEDVMGAYWIGEGFPVDPYAIARQIGIDVRTAPLPDDVAGMLVKRDDRQPTIYLNVADTEVRQRFTCAHELGHYTKHVGDGTHELGFVDRRDLTATKGTDPEEQFANAFAANLLMPAGTVKRLHEDGLSNARMASYFEVSLAAMNNRLATLKLT